jgi:hypothetical protein
MDAVIDPVEVKVVGVTPVNSILVGPWVDFITLPVPEGADQETLGVESDGQGGFTFVTDPAKVQAKLDAQWTSVRAQQRQKLYESDWTCSVTDYEVPNKSEWAAYRQALRDVTTQTDPFAIVWPVAPSE